MEIKWNVHRATHYQLLRIKSLKEFLLDIKKDKDKDIRLAQQECLYCYYRTILAGQGFTDYTCSICHEKKSYHNTAIPTLCLNCAKNNNLCQRCGCDMDYDEKRNDIL